MCSLWSGVMALKRCGHRWEPRTYSRPLDSVVTGSSGIQIEHICVPSAGQNVRSWCHGVGTWLPGSLTKLWS